MGRGTSSGWTFWPPSPRAPAWAEPKGTGVGRALLTFCEDYIRAQGKHQCRLYTHVKYTRSQQIYLRQGYTIYDRVQEEGFDRYYMKKDL